MQSTDLDNDSKQDYQSCYSCQGVHPDLTFNPVRVHNVVSCVSVVEDNAPVKDKMFKI